MCRGNFLFLGIRRHRRRTTGHLYPPRGTKAPAAAAPFNASRARRLENCTPGHYCRAPTTDRSPDAILWAKAPHTAPRKGGCGRDTAYAAPSDLHRSKHHAAHRDLRANNRPVCVANEEVLALRLGSSPGAPSESRLDGSECIGQRCDRTAMKACLCQRRVQMTAGRLSTRSCPAGYGGGLLQSRKDALRSRSAWPWDMHPTPDHGFSHS